MPKRAKAMSSTVNKLDDQKRRIKRIAVDYLYAALFMLLIDIIVLIVALTLDDKVHTNRILFIAIPILSGFCAIFLFFSIKLFLLFRAFNKARFNDEYLIKIDCKSVKFITYARARSIVGIIGIKFIDTNSEKYIYILPDELGDSKIERAETRRKYVGKTVELRCYNDTK